jgi:hypothetical protein
VLIAASVVREAADEIDRLRHEARYGTHLIATAKSLGWKNDGEGPQEFLLRRTRVVALEDCADEIERWRRDDELMRAAMLSQADEIERLRATLTDAEWVGYYFGLQRALNMKRLPSEFVSFLDHEMREVESKLPPGTIESWPKEVAHEIEQLNAEIEDMKRANDHYVRVRELQARETAAEIMRLRAALQTIAGTSKFEPPPPGEAAEIARVALGNSNVVEAVLRKVAE